MPQSIDDQPVPGPDAHAGIAPVAEADWHRSVLAVAYWALWVIFGVWGRCPPQRVHERLPAHVPRREESHFDALREPRLSWIEENQSKRAQVSNGRVAIRALWRAGGFLQESKWVHPTGHVVPDALGAAGGPHPVRAAGRNSLAPFSARAATNASAPEICPLRCTDDWIV